MEAGNREEEGRRRLGAPVPSSPYSPHQHIPYNDLQYYQREQQSQQHSHFSPSRHQRHYSHDHDSPIDYAAHNNNSNHHHHPYDDRSPQISGASYAAENYQAAAANVTIDLAGAFGSPAADPDDFYRNYRGVQSNTNIPLLPSPIPESMASGISGTRQVPSPRTNGAGTPKQPGVPGSRIATRPAYRSASNPVDDRSALDGARARSATNNGFNGSSQPSVKDLKKRFDQNTSQPVTGPRKLASRNPPKDTSSGSVNGRSPVLANGQSYSALRGMAAQEPGTGSTRSSASRGTQRTKFVAEDHMSSNSQSFASRISRPRTSVSSNVQASKSMTHLPSPASPNPPSSPPPPTRTGGLLFGEIRPEELDAVTAGYGIDVARPRRTSESHLRKPIASTHQRSLSDAVVEPSSPTDWYRSASTAPPEDGQVSGSRIPKSHARAHSDLAGSKPNSNSAIPQTRRHVERAQTPAQTPQPPSPSRLPLSVKKLNSPSNPTSPASTRSNSPANSKRPVNTTRTPRQQGPPVAMNRAKTPTARSTTPITRAKTPTHSNNTSTIRKPAPTSIATPNNTRLAAYISAPPPKLSPPLRSSRPRQPVSSATTASSRLKQVDRSKSPHKPMSRPPSRPVSRQDAPTTRRRKISVGPVDFAERRETIKLKYSKSIRESEARQVREAAAERRKKELEAAARAKVQAEAKAQAAAAAAEAAVAQAKEHPKSSETSRAASPADRQLRLTTSLGQTSIPEVFEQPSAANDSPTLGVPGSFPSFGSPPIGSEEAPLSAVSATTVVTEFDGETQTEPPVQGDALHIVQPGHETTAQPRRSLAPHEKAMYKDPFEEVAMQDEHASIKISLEAASPLDVQQLTPTNTEFEPEHIIPGAFQDEYEPQPEYGPQHYFEPQVEEEVAQPRHEPEPEYEPQPYVAPAYQKTTVTILSRDPGFGPFHIQPADEGPDNRSETHEYAHESEEQQSDLLDSFYTGRHLKDNIASLRDSTLSCSEPDEQAVFTDTEHTPDTSNSLTVPPLMSPANRSSQHSVWTDFSIDSNESHGRLSRESASHFQGASFPDGRHGRPADPKPESIREEMSFRQQPYSPDMSPMDVSETFATGRFPSYHEKQHALPELDTGEGFAIPYVASTANVPAVPQLPNHAPPPPPSAGEDHRYTSESRRTSGYYDETRPSSSLHREDRSSYTFATSRRESEDYAHALSTPHSADQVSLDIDGVTPGLTPIDGERRSLSTGELPSKPASSDKERNRLNQRQNVIKELIDTEAVFVRDMNVIEEIYKGTAEACPKLDDKTIKLIFRNTDEIITFHTVFLQELKDGVASVYVPKGRRSPALKEDTTMSSDATTINSMASTAVSAVPSTAASSTTAVSVAGLSMTGVETDDAKDRQSAIGPCFSKNIEKMKAAHEGFLRTSDHAAKRLIQIQEDPTVKVWLNECNEVAKDLTAAWNLDSLLIKPMQRITKYPNLISQLLQYTPADHPDREALTNARTTLENAILEINKTKKNFELVGQIVGRKRKESDVKAGFAKAFGRRVDKLQASSNRPEEDPEYAKLHEKFGDDYLRLQVVLRDVEFYTRQVSAYVHEFLQYLSSIELVMRLQPGPYPEIESKWVQFNVSMRDIEKVALEQHLSQVRKHVIEPFELVIRCYSNPSTAMKKRSKRRLDYEKYIQLKKGGKKIDKSLSELVEQYEALNETLKKELPKLSALTEKIGNICLGNFVNIQAKWYSIWKEKVKVVLGNSHTPETSEIVNTFHRDFKDMEDAILSIGILNPLLKGRSSQSTTDGDLLKTRSRPSDLSTRTRGLSVNSEIAPSLPTPDFAKRNSGQFALSPTVTATTTLPSPQQYYYRDYYAGINGHARGASSPITPDLSAGARSAAPGSARPSTGRSYDSSGAPRPSIDSTTQPTVPPTPRDPNSAYNSPGLGPEGRRFSGLFHSALPLADATEESQRSSRASSRERNPSNGYNVLWLAASLFEFNIETTKHEAGYPYLTYQAGEIFDVIAEKGELWLAKNQDDPNDMVGWIWSKHFAKLADS